MMMMMMMILDIPDGLQDLQGFHGRDRNLPHGTPGTAWVAETFYRESSGVPQPHSLPAARWPD